MVHLKTAIPKSKLFWARTALAVSDIIVFCSLNPNRSSAAWLIIGYSMLALTLFMLASLASKIAQTALGTSGQTARRLLRYVAAALTIAIGLQSIGQCSLKDLAALLPLCVLAYWYYGYGKSRVSAAA